jgi:hypothetical protein
MLCKEWIGREKEIKLLCDNIESVYGPPLIIYGPSCCGKTGIMKKLIAMRQARMHAIYLNAAHWYSEVSVIINVLCVCVIGTQR